MIGHIMQFFQSQNYFTPLTHPALDARIEQINVDLFTLNFEQINHIWSTLGGKYLPSVMYKVRQLAVEDENAEEVEGRLIESIRTETSLINR
jgi:Pvc16 N-terminal domain